MTCGHLMAHRDPVQREGQGQLQDPERPLLFRVAGGAVLKVGRKDRHHAPANHPEMPAGGVRLESKRPVHAAALGHRPAASPMTAPGSAWTEAWYGCPSLTFGLGKPGVSHSRPPASSAAPAHRTA